MSMQMIGGISVQLAADVAKLKKDMDDAEKVVNGSAGVMSRSVDMLKIGFAGLITGIAAGTGIIAAWVKTALDAADATKQFSQKTGVAAEDVAGLQLAFKQGGVESGALQSAIAKMSKQMAEGSDGFKKLGVETRNADGTLRGAKDVLYDVADATAELGSGLGTTATLQGIFGKSAAELVPTLLEGSEGLRNMAEMAQKLGLVISEETADQADKFNDTVELLGMGLTGIGRTIMAQLVPTLTNLADSFLTSMTEGDRLRRAADILAGSMKAIYSVVLGVIEVFNTFGKVVGGLIAAQLAGLSALGDAFVKVFKGDFSGAAEAATSGFRQIASITKEAGTDITQGWQTTGAAISKTWDETSSTTIGAMSGMAKKGKELVILTKEQEEAAKKAAEAEAKRLAELEKLMAGLDKQIATIELEIQSETKLTAVQKQALDIMLKIQDGTLKLTTAEKKAVTVKLEMALASEAHQTELEKEKKQMEAGRKENERYYDGLEKTTETLQAEIAKQKEANLMYGKTAEAIAKIEIARLEEQAVAKDRLALWAEENWLGQEVVEQYREQARALRELAGLKGQKVMLEMAKEAESAWKKTTDTIGSSFTDSLFRAFEKGKTFGEAFLESVQNLFKTTVMQVLVKPVQTGINDFIGGLFGGGNSGSGGGGLLSGVSSLFSGFKSLFSNGSTGIIDMFKNGASSFMSSVGSMFGVGGASTSVPLSTGMGFTGASSNAAFTSAAGSGAGASSGFMGIPVVGWIIAGMMASGAAYDQGFRTDGSSQDLQHPINHQINMLDKLAQGIGLDPKTAAILTGSSLGAQVVHTVFGGSTLSDAGGALVGNFTSGGASLQQRTDTKQDHRGFLGMGSYTTTNSSFAAASTEVDSFYDNALKAITKANKAYAVSLGLNADALDGFSQAVDINTTGMDENAKKAAIAGALSKFATEQVAHAFGDALASFRKDGEEVIDTLLRLSALQQFSQNINEFGGIFSEVALLSVDAKENLLEFAGGMEAFVAKTGQFVNDYYSEAEKYGMQAKQLQTALLAAGVTNPGDLKTKEDYRKLVESQDLSTEAGRKAFNQLLDLAPLFASLNGFMTTNEQTLGQLAESAPQTAILEQMIQANDAETTRADAATALAQAQIDATTQGSILVADAVGIVAERIGKLEAAMVRVGTVLDQTQTNGTYANGGQGA